MKAYAILLAATLTASFTARAQSKPDRIWDGVFTAAQADRGKAAFLTSCSNCHNADLAGSVRGPALKGERFMLSWQNGSIARLFIKIRDAMPATYPETVPEDVKLDIVSFLLQTNGFPTGSAELKLDLKEIEEIQIVKRGDRSVPNFALVQVTGCVEAGSGKSWMLARASEPAVTREGAASVAQALGGETYLLVSAAAFKPEIHKGEKMEARGLLYRDSSGARVNLTSLLSLKSECK